MKCHGLQDTYFMDKEKCQELYVALKSPLHHVRMHMYVIV